MHPHTKDNNMPEYTLHDYDEPEAKQPPSAGCHPTPCSPVGFSPVAPVYEGGYYMRCMENDHEPEWVNIYWRGGILRASLDSLGDYDLRSIHEGLTDVTWRRAISIQENK